MIAAGRSARGAGAVDPGPAAGRLQPDDDCDRIRGNNFKTQGNNSKKTGGRHGIG
jgi:hypothetical protein